MENLIIAQIDGTKNDVEGVIVDGFPTIYLYGVGNDQNGVAYGGELSVKGITKFLQKQMGDDFLHRASDDDTTDPDL